MRYRIKSVETPRYPLLRVTFDDGLTGEVDLSDDIAMGGIFAPLADERVFQTVAVDPFGWNLDRLGQEIDFCPDTIRIEIETQTVSKMAADFRARRTAAE
jgi:hypothetical protein